MQEHKPRKPNPSDSWVAPEHSKMGQGMRRYKRGFRGSDGMFIHCPGERVLPEPECMRHQNETEKIKQLAIELGMKFVPPEIVMEYLRPKKVSKKFLTAF